MNLITKHNFTLSLLLGLSTYTNVYALPASFDLRDIDGKSYINDVKDQNPYGTCYAFGAASAAEGSYNYTMNLHDENRATFSETFIVWFHIIQKLCKTI